MKAKKKNISFTNPDDLNKNLQYSSPITWIVLSSVILLLVGLFAWSVLYKLELKVSGMATIANHVATLKVDESSLSKLEVNQKVYISGVEGKILSFDEKTKQPTVSAYDLADGDYQYYIVIKEGVRPIEFLLNK